MVDAFPLPRHREKLCYAGSQHSRKGSQLNGTPIRRRSITRAVLGDIQRAVEHLQLTMSNYDSSSSHGTSWHKTAWRKLPKMGKKPFEGWPVRDAAEGHVSLRPTSPAISDALPNGRQRHSNIPEKDEEGHGEYGLATAPQPMSSSQSNDDRASQFSALISPLSHRPLDSQDVVGVLPSSPTSPNSHSPGYSNSPTTPFSMTSPLSRSHSAPYSSSRERLYVHPTEWTVEETVKWLRSKGFDDSVCEKFIEQETAGDALLNLDAASLKTEIGIIPYGKRFRIANAIDDLRRVASVRFPLAKQLSWPRSPSHESPQPSRPGLRPLLLHSTSAGSLMSPLAQPMSDHPPKSPMLLPFRESSPSVQPTVERPTESDIRTGAISPLYSPRSGQDRTLQGSPLRLSSFRSDGALVANAKRAAIGPEGEKRGKAIRCDNGTMYLAAQRHPRFDESLSPSAVKRSLSPSTEPTTSLPQVAPLKSRSSPLFREWREGSWDAPSPTSTLMGTPAFISKSPQNSFGNWMASTPSLPIDDDTWYRKEGEHETQESNSSAGWKGKSPTPLRRSASLSADTSLCASPEPSTRTLVDTVLVQIGTSDHEGWMRKKGGHSGKWRNRYLVLKGPYLYWLGDDNAVANVEGHVNVVGCRVVPDENINPGSYGFKLLRGVESIHFFSSDDQTVVREWMKALLKPNIKRDNKKAAVFPVDISVVPLEIAQAMNPRPPSPSSAAATQRAIRRENSIKSSTRGGATLTKVQSMQVLSGQNDKISGRPRSGSFTSGVKTKGPAPLSTSAKVKAPVRPPRDERRKGFHGHPEPGEQHQFAEQSLMKWANDHLPGTQVNPGVSNCSGVDILQIVESIKDIRSCCAPEGVSSQGPEHETLEGLFSLLDFLFGEDDKVGPGKCNDVRQCKRDKVMLLLRALRAWEGHRAILQPIGTSTGCPSQPQTVS